MLFTIACGTIFPISCCRRSSEDQPCPVSHRISTIELPPFFQRAFLQGVHVRTFRVSPSCLSRGGNQDVKTDHSFSSFPSPFSPSSSKLPGFFFLFFLFATIVPVKVLPESAFQSLLLVLLVSSRLDVPIFMTGHIFFLHEPPGLANFSCVPFFLF